MLLLAIIGLFLEEIYILILLIQFIDRVPFLNSLANVIKRKGEQATRFGQAILSLLILVYMFAYAVFFFFPEYDDECSSVL